MEYTYRTVIDPLEHAKLYHKLKEQDLLWVLFPEVEEGCWTEDLYIKLNNSSTNRETWLGYVDGELAGIAYLWPFCDSYRTCCAEIGLCAFRPHFERAARLARGCLIEMLRKHNGNLQSFVGRVPVVNRHILSMLGDLGFHKVLRIPKLCWFTRLQKHVDGWLVFAEPCDIKATWEVE